MRTLITFMKTGRAACMSHLDLQRAMLRGLRSAGVRPVYSSGFNPHPKLSLALPLSLGFESLCEYLEVTTEKPFSVSAGELDRTLPDGVVVVSIGEIAERGASVASRVRYAGYDIVAPNPDGVGEGVAEHIGRYLAQERIIAAKENRKKGRTDEIDIKPMIKELVPERKVGERAHYACTLSAHAGAVLNPLLLMKSFYGFCGMPAVNDDEFTVTRTKIILAK
ncbi:MAG: TIGR03936 family radical SAM-associated protein [Clostridiales Family XIII bacterium]|jgi:radical SAM-linked protein|nr:TIGR03936 family radical SAM-associated protein [Clostridiales Family XIII bacterium]